MALAQLSLCLLVCIVHWPLKLLQEKWLNNDKKQNILGCVSAFHFKHRWACKIAKQNLAAVPKRMKSWFNKKKKPKPGDRVLVSVPISSTSLLAHYSSIFVVEEKKFATLMTSLPCSTANDEADCVT